MLQTLQCRCIIQMLLLKVKTAEKSLQELIPSIFTKASNIILWRSTPVHCPPPRAPQNCCCRSACYCRSNRLESMKDGSKCKVLKETRPKEVTSRQSKVTDHHSIRWLVRMAQRSVLLTLYCACDKIENGMGGACGTYGGRERCAQGFGGET